MPPLKNIKHETFCKEYIRTKGDRQASVINAGFNVKTSKYGSTSASATATRLLKDVNVAARIQELQAREANEFIVDRNEVLRELARIGMCDTRRFYNANGSLKKITELDDDAAHALAGVEVYEEFIDGRSKDKGKGGGRMKIGETFKIKQWDKPTALKMLGEHLGLFGSDDKGKGGNQLTVNNINFYLPHNNREPLEQVAQHGGNGHAESPVTIPDNGRGT